MDGKARNHAVKEKGRERADSELARQAKRRFYPRFNEQFLAAIVFISPYDTEKWARSDHDLPQITTVDLPITEYHKGNRNIANNVSH